MTYMTPNIQLRTRAREKSILGTLGISLPGGQSFFVNEYWPNQGLVLCRHHDTDDDNYDQNA